MTKSIDFYFDFISPYSYLAYKKIDKLGEVNINYKPILLGGLHKLGGITAPAFNERKMKNMKNDCELVAKKNNIQFKWNTKFPINSLSLMRGYLVVKPELKKEYFNNCFEAYWKNNIDISIEKNIKEILKNTNVDEINFFKKISLKQVKEDLKELTNTAFKNDIFGAPTFVVNNKIFWGQDRLDYALDEYHS
jgi:2-hydroxychromene-2-carboxylate isomerase